MASDRRDQRQDRLHGREPEVLGSRGGTGSGYAPGTTSELERIKALERENRELRQANEILLKAYAYFA